MDIVEGLCRVIMLYCNLELSDVMIFLVLNKPVGMLSNEKKLMEVLFVGLVVLLCKWYLAVEDSQGYSSMF